MRKNELLSQHPLEIAMPKSKRARQYYERIAWQEQANLADGIAYILDSEKSLNGEGHLPYSYGLSEEETNSWDFDYEHRQELRFRELLNKLTQEPLDREDSIYYQLKRQSEILKILQTENLEEFFYKNLSTDSEGIIRALQAFIAGKLLYKIDSNSLKRFGSNPEEVKYFSTVIPSITVTSELQIVQRRESGDFTICYSSNGGYMGGLFDAVTSSDVSDLTVSRAVREFFDQRINRSIEVDYSSGAPILAVTKNLHNYLLEAGKGMFKSTGMLWAMEDCGNNWRLVVNHCGDVKGKILISAKGKDCWVELKEFPEVDVNDIFDSPAKVLSNITANPLLSLADKRIANDLYHAKIRELAEKKLNAEDMPGVGVLGYRGTFYPHLTCYEVMIPKDKFDIMVLSCSDGLNPFEDVYNTDSMNILQAIYRDLMLSTKLDTASIDLRLMVAQLLFDKVVGNVNIRHEFRSKLDDKSGLVMASPGTTFQKHKKDYRVVLPDHDIRREINEKLKDTGYEEFILNLIFKISSADSPHGVYSIPLES